MVEEQCRTIEYYRAIRDKAKSILEQLDGYSMSEIEDILKHIRNFSENIKLSTKLK